MPSLATQGISSGQVIHNQRKSEENFQIHNYATACSITSNTRKLIKGH